jgi:hypothetical protein
MLRSPLLSSASAEEFSLSIQTDFGKPFQKNTEARSPIVVPAVLEEFTRSFASKDQEGLFLGEISPESQGRQRSQFMHTRRMAKHMFFAHAETVIEPTAIAVERTKQAARTFFSLAYQVLAETEQPFPLAGLNKCLGMVAVPDRKLVMIAISQDKVPTKDVALRQAVVALLAAINQKSSDWVFELACIPTKAQYLMPRTLSMRAPHQAPETWVAPRTRCIEVALMVALCKLGRNINFLPEDTGVMAFGGTLWGSAEGEEAVAHFEGASRNKTYTKEAPLEVKLTDDLSGWLDIWEPCAEHCARYRQAMLVIGAAGGPATSFVEPRSETSLSI